MDSYMQKNLYQRSGSMRKKYDRVNLKKDTAKLLGLKNAACGIILEAQSDETFAIKAFESPKVSRKKAVQNRVPTKKDVEKLMKTVQPNMHLMHLQRGLIYLLLKHMDVIYEAADKAVVENFREIEEMLNTPKNKKVKEKNKNIIYVNFDKDTIH